MLSATSAAIYHVPRQHPIPAAALRGRGHPRVHPVADRHDHALAARHRDQRHWRRSLAFNATGAALSGIVFVIEGVTKFTAGAWVAIALIGAITVTALRTRRYYDLAGEQLALRAEEAATPAGLPAKFAPRPPSSRPEGAAAPGCEAAGAEQPGQVNTLTIVLVEVLDRAGIQALAYAAALGQPAFALHISPTTEEADRFLGYWRAWGDHLPLEVIVSPHRAVIAPLANYFWTLHGQRPDLTLTIVIPELVDRHWWQRILHEHLTRRLQPVLQPLPRVVITSVPFQLAD
jgi:hypothetical protein